MLWQGMTAVTHTQIYAMHTVSPLSSPFAPAALHAAAQAPLASGCRRPLAVTLDTPEKFARPPVTPPPEYSSFRVFNLSVGRYLVFQYDSLSILRTKREPVSIFLQTSTTVLS